MDAKPNISGSFIITTDKENFLQEEFNHMGNIFGGNYSKYKKIMLENAKICKICNVYYWDGCMKRCLCQ